MASEREGDEPTRPGTEASRSAEARATRMQRLYSVVAAINQQIVRVRDADALLCAACRIAVEQGQFRFAWVGTVDAGGHVDSRCHAGVEEGYLAEAEVLAINASSHVGPTSRALTSGAPVVCDDISEDPQMRPWRELALRRGYRSSASFPFRRGGRVVGALNVYADQPRFFDAENVALLETLAGDLGAALDGIDLDEHRRQAEAALRLSEDRYRSLVHHAADGILLVDGARAVDANPAASEILGTSRDELLASKDVVAALGIVALAPGATVTFERAASRPDGLPVDVEIHARGLENGHVQAILRDLGPRRRLQASMAQHERLLALGRLARGVAHEINNPMAYVALNLEACETHLRSLGGEPALRATMAAALTEAREGAARVRRIVRDLSSFGRGGDEEEVGLVDVHGVIDAALNLAESATRGRARVVRRYGPDGHARANEQRLGQVFLNLVLNAVAAIREGAADRNEIRISTTVEDGELVALVTDTGHGIDPAVIERVFDPFFTTKPLGEASGLGLAIAHGIVTGLGGKLSVSSAQGAGATFRVALPRGVKEAASAAKIASAGRAQALRLLLVDDESGIRNVLGRMLSGHEVMPAASGREAIALCGRHEFDCIVCDVTMADGDGVDLFEHLRAEGKGREASIVFMTGGAFSERVEEFLARVGNPCLEKPFVFAALEDAIAKVASR